MLLLMDINAFFENNVIWLTPVFSILLTIVLKLSMKSDLLTRYLFDIFDFGIDLSVSSLMVLSTAKQQGNFWIILQLENTFTVSLGK